MNLFFFDGNISQALAFEELLNSGEAFAKRLLYEFPNDQTTPRLVNVATDGETYGHHHRGGDMALAYALHYIERNGMAKLTNYGQFLENQPPTHEVEIFENSSWSCIHGIERWRSDCGCNSGGRQDWNQAWRAPLRAALDGLRDAVEPAYEKLAEQFLTDPWGARDDYIDVMLDRSPDRVNAFLERHATRPFDSADQTKILQLMELQRHAMLMYTSCGWFFDELSGIETVQVMQYAGRVLQLADQLFSGSFEPEFLERLELAKSNIPEHKNGRIIYERFVRPAMLDSKNVGAHYAISSLFQDTGERSSIYSYSAVMENYRNFQVGTAKLVVGRAKITSKVTGTSTRLCFGVLHLGDHNIACGTGEYRGSQEYEALVKEVSEAFAIADFPRTILLLGKHFGASTYSLSSLFADERRKILNVIMEPTLREAEASYCSIYEHHAPLIRFLQASGMPLPKGLALAAELSLNAKLRREIQQDGFELEVIRPLMEEARLAGANLDETALGLLVAGVVENMSRQLLEQPEDLNRMIRLNKAAKLFRTLPFEINIWKTQNICYNLVHTYWPDFNNKAILGDKNAQNWVNNCTVLARNFWIRLPKKPVAVTYGETIAREFLHE